MPDDRRIGQTPDYRRISQTPDPRQAGFTLVELLVSLVLLSMAALLLLAAMTTGHGIERRGANAALAGESVAAAHRLLRDRIETMLPEAQIVPGGALVALAGETDSLGFIAPPPAALRPAPPQRFRLLLTRDGTLALFSIDPLTARTDPDAPPTADWATTPLLGNVAGLAIDYFGAAPPDNQRRWRPRWSQRPGMPELVRIRIAFAPGDPRLWPDLVIHPAATIDTSCAVDRKAPRCRADGA